MDHTEYAALDALDLARLVAAGETTAAELLEVARKRAHEVNPAVNAVVRWLDDEADARVRVPLAGPFAGVPFLLKDLRQAIAGVPTSWGARALASWRPAETDTVVRRWLDAGLVVFGQTGASNLTEISEV